MEQIKNERMKRETLEMMKNKYNFGMMPCEKKYELEDRSRFTRLELNSAGKMYVSALLQQLPTAAAAQTLANVYIVRFPEGLPHTLTALSQGGLGTMIRDESGKFAGMASLYKIEESGIFLSVFSAMSIATGQYFLTQINREMNMINLKMDRILEFLYGEKKAELISEIHFVKYAYQNYSSIMTHESQRTATIGSLQASKKVAIKDVEFYIKDLNAKVNDEARKYGDFDRILGTSFQMKDSLELSLQLYIMSCMMEVYYSQNQDSAYMTYLERDMTAYIEKCEKQMLGSFSVLHHRMSEFKGGLMEKIDKSPNMERIDRVIDILGSSEGTEIRKALHRFLEETRGIKEYFLTEKGEVYVKAR